MPDIDPLFHTVLSQDQEALYTQWEKLLKYTTQLPPEGKSIKTILLPTGFYKDRIGPALEEYKEYWWTQQVKPKLVISGDVSERIHNSLSADDIKKIYETEGHITAAMDQHILTDTTAMNTKDNAAHTYAFLKEGKISAPIVIITSIEHLPRMYATFVKIILENEKEHLRTQLFSIPIERHWEDSLPGSFTKKPRMLFVPSEMQRILAYQEKGDVATEEELQFYLAFLHK